MPLKVTRYAIADDARQEALDRLRAQSEPGENGCRLWRGSLNRSGYGYLTIRGDRWMAHRLTWAAVMGEIPKGQFVCHRCDNPTCIELAHLFLGDHTENQRDMVRKGRHAKGSKTHCKRGHELSGDNVRHINGHRHCVLCNRRRQRINAGWPVELAETMGVTPHGHRPVNGSFKRARSQT